MSGTRMCRGCKSVRIPSDSNMCGKCAASVPSIHASCDPMSVGSISEMPGSAIAYHHKEDEKKEQGLKFDSQKSAVHLIPPRAIEEEGYVWGFGEKKYGTWNWAKGLAILRICGAILRHTLAIMAGQDLDPESGKHHGAHIRCCAGMLIHFYYEGRSDLDDRPDKELK